MAVKTLFVPMTHKAQSSSRRKTSLLPVCCLCGLIRDETRASHDHECWVTQRTYRKTYGVNPIHCRLTHTYCPVCFTRVMRQVREITGQPELKNR